MNAKQVAYKTIYSIGKLLLILGFASLLSNMFVALALTTIGVYDAPYWLNVWVFITPVCLICGFLISAACFVYDDAG